MTPSQRAAPDPAWVERLRRAFAAAQVPPSGTRHVQLSAETLEAR